MWYACGAKLVDHQFSVHQKSKHKYVFNINAIRTVNCFREVEENANHIIIYYYSWGRIYVHAEAHTTSMTVCYAVKSCLDIRESLFFLAFLEDGDLAKFAQGQNDMLTPPKNCGGGGALKCSRKHQPRINKISKAKKWGQ